ncbi:glutaredoxin family protein [Candidatus Pelagadaptatus aseana]|uniref:glutaredoxin family protein n=1 Tax=Candidatus Pelagadaptatus aseana TaxID=3120508 RepID=UPI003C7024E4
MDLILYTTLGCHLCDRAKDVIWPVLQQYPYRLKEVDIADDEGLVERYGVRIPVVSREDLAEDLGWPFDAEKLEWYLSK